MASTVSLQFLALILMWSMIPASASTIEPEDLRAYTDRELGFRLAYPKAWVTNHLDDESPFSIRGTDKVTLGVFSVNAVNLADYGSDADQVIPDLLKDGGHDRYEFAVETHGDARLEEATETFLGGEDAVMTRVDYRHRALDVDVWIASVQLVAVHGERVYVLTFESPLKSFDDNWEVFRRIVYSFHFLE